jgi:hypothetical protein
MKPVTYSGLAGAELLPMNTIHAAPGYEPVIRAYATSPSDTLQPSIERGVAP